MDSFDLSNGRWMIEEIIFHLEFRFLMEILFLLLFKNIAINIIYPLIIES